MPPPKDLSGKRFGMLEVIRATGKRQDMSKENTIWLCHCHQCGRDEEIVQLLIPHTAYKQKRRGVRYACTICSRGPCAVCGGENIDGVYVVVCSEACHIEHKRKLFREFHYRRLAENPNYWNEQHQLKKARIESNPELKEKQRKQWAERAAKRAEKERDRLNAQGRERYWKNRGERMQRRKELLDKLSEEERILKELQAQARRREYWEKNGERILEKRRLKAEALTEEEREARRARARELHRKRQQERALNELMQASQELIVRKGKNDE